MRRLAKIKSNFCRALRSSLERCRGAEDANSNAKHGFGSVVLIHTITDGDIKVWAWSSHDDVGFLRYYQTRLMEEQKFHRYLEFLNCGSACILSFLARDTKGEWEG